MRPDIILIDDDAVDLMAIQRALAEVVPHAKVSTAAGSQEGFALLKRVSEEHGAAPLVLLDLSMPHVDGMELLRNIKSDPTLCNFPVCFLSSVDTPAVRTLAAEVGAFGYFIKPFQHEEFVGLLNQLIAFWRGSRWPTAPAR